VVVFRLWLSSFVAVVAKQRLPFGVVSGPAAFVFVVAIVIAFFAPLICPNPQTSLHPLDSDTLYFGR